jgi:sodium/potassium/calcium exchanger 6
LCVVAAPSVFLLAITLPVVETEAVEDDETNFIPPDGGLLTPREDGSRSRANTIAKPPSPTAPIRPLESNGDYFQSSIPTSNGKPFTATAADEHNHPTGPAVVDTPTPPTPKEWNRWLVGLQAFTGPLFVTLIVWANTMSDRPSALYRMSLYALIGSCLAVTVLMLTSTAAEPPRWRPVLCFFGFVVSVAWISTIAGEVVGVLKAFGVILGISDAILGLTIFAVGNSLGDLVANTTVARLYPVMALSSCFGGPMLNILLGIGISGLYMTITHGNQRHAKHPHDVIRYKPYQIEVSNTLVISGASLLVTLVGLLIVVPWNGWKMDRKIGWGLIGLWSISTLGNVIVEVVDVGGNRS